ncbi:MAG: [protein-PII] uridylyltransferase [Spirochaetota bacterium]|nr:[protein-PII] uridylyltransferase [Spirochaetota bacterium]
MIYLYDNKSIKLKPEKEIQFAHELKEIYLDKLNNIKNQKINNGYKTCKILTETMDELITYIYNSVIDTYKYNINIAVIALGGYGRNELNPFSDVDIIFLHDENDVQSEEFITKILYIIWDMKLKLGHSSRSIKNVYAMANKDLIFKTSIIHNRFLCGNIKLYNDFKIAVEKIFNNNNFNFYHELLNHMKYHEQNLGENVLLKEPNIKNTLGTLRGIHLIRWLTYNFLKTNTLKSLTNNNFVDFNTINRIENILEYFLRVRNELHFHHGREEDTLSLEYQEKIPKIINYDDFNTKYENPDQIKITIENYMRDFYSKAKEVYQFVVTVIEKFDQEANKYRQFTRMLNRKKINDNFIIINKKLYFKKKLNEYDSPNYLIEIFKHVAKYDCRLSAEIENYIKINIEKIDDNFRHNIDIFNQFKDILTLERNIYKTLSTMHHEGFLKSYLPYFNELDCIVQHDYYHVYTADEHTLQSVKKIEELYHQDDKNFSFFQDILLKFNREQKFILIFSLLYHDIGKGRPGNHVENGREIIDHVMNVFPLSENEIKNITFLVNNHIIMSHTSQRRDIHDIKVLYNFIANVYTKEKLNFLILLTISDMSAVGPNILTLWKAEILKELYLKSLEIIEDTPFGKFPIIKEKDLEKVKNKVIDKINNIQLDFVKSFFNNIDQRFIVDNNVDEIIFCINTLFESNNKPILNYEKHLDSYKVTFYGKDSLGLFSKLALILAMNGINIHSTNIYSKINGYAINYYTVSSIYSANLISDTRWKSLINDLNIFLDGDFNEGEKLFNERKKNFPKVKAQYVIPKIKVSINNDLSDHFTVIEIETLDQLGILFQISRIISLNKLNIKSAFCYVHGNKIIDTFYVENQTGGKVENENLLDQLRNMLIINLTEIRFQNELLLNFKNIN